MQLRAKQFQWNCPRLRDRERWFKGILGITHSGAYHMTIFSALLQYIFYTVLCPGNILPVLWSKPTQQ